MGDLSHLVSEETSKYFEKQSMNRMQCRMKEKEMLEEEEKRNKIMEEQRVALQKQKYAKPQIDINDEAEFPSLSGHSKSDSNSDKDQQSDLSPRPALQRGMNELNRSYSSMAVHSNEKKEEKNEKKEEVVKEMKKKKRRHRGGRNRKKKKKMTL